ncbi:MAG: hypothetical protein ACYDFT_04455 [Thermoplasmata archaeon]
MPEEDVGGELYHATLPGPGEKHLAFLGPAEDEGGARGYLVLTDRRVIFVARPTLGQRRYVPLFRADLAQIGRISIDAGRLSTVLSINDASFRFSHIVGDIRKEAVLSFRGQVTHARHLVVETPAPSRSPAPLPVAPAPARPEVIQREVIREVVMVPCRFCSNLMAVTDRRCASCGASRSQ